MQKSEFISKVLQMRQAQKEYFSLSIQARKNKTLYDKVKPALIQSKSIEAEVDEAIAKFIESKENQEKTECNFKAWALEWFDFMNEFWTPVNEHIDAKRNRMVAELADLIAPPLCQGNCGMNYCDENGCQDRKRFYVHIDGGGYLSRNTSASSLWSGPLVSTGINAYRGTGGPANGTSNNSCNDTPDEIDEGGEL